MGLFFFFFSYRNFECGIFVTTITVGLKTSPIPLSWHSNYTNITSHLLKILSEYHHHCCCCNYFFYSMFRRGRIQLKRFSLKHHIGFLGLQVHLLEYSYLMIMYYNLLFLVSNHNAIYLRKCICFCLWEPGSLIWRVACRML